MAVLLRRSTGQKSSLAKAAFVATPPAQDGWTCEWQPGRWHRGLAVLARSPYRIESREPSEPSAFSTVIAGPDRLRFVGFMTEKDVGYTYTRQAKRVIEGLPHDGLS